MGKEENIIGLPRSWQLTNVINVLKSYECAAPLTMQLTVVEVGPVGDVEAAHKRLFMCRKAAHARHMCNLSPATYQLTCS